jgi:hypothetical protein
MKHISVVVVSIMWLAGCDRQNGTPSTEPAPNEGGVHIKAPGVDVKIKKGEGVDVEAPGTKVKVQPKE